MKKIIILIFSLFLLSGCTATYNLTILDEKNIKEELIINDDTMTLEEANLNFSDILIDSTIIVDDDDLSTISEKYPRYNKKIEDINNVRRVTYSYDSFNFNTLKNSNIAKAGFNNIGIINNSGKIQLSTNNSLKAILEYPTLNSLIINIKTDYKVVEHNATNVSGNVYSWSFNRNDYNKNILLVLDKSNNESNIDDSDKSHEDEGKEMFSTKKDEKKDKQYTPTYVVLLCVIGFFFILLVLFIIKNKMN